MQSFITMLAHVENSMNVSRMIGEHGKQKYTENIEKIRKPHIQQSLNYAKSVEFSGHVYAEFHHRWNILNSLILKS